MREQVRRHYAAAARSAREGSGGGATAAEPPGREAFGAALYAAGEGAGVPLEASFGCGAPTAVADLHPGEVVLDLGARAGADVLIAARRVAPGGRAVGLDMTDEC